MCVWYFKVAYLVRQALSQGQECRLYLNIFKASLLELSLKTLEQTHRKSQLIILRSRGTLPTLSSSPLYCFNPLSLIPTPSSPGISARDLGGSEEDLESQNLAEKGGRELTHSSRGANSNIGLLVCASSFHVLQKDILYSF